MNKITEALNWMANRLEDKRDLTPLPPAHPFPSYVNEADEEEHKAWELYLLTIEEELESEKGNPDYRRLSKARENWIKATNNQSEARRQWELEKEELLRKNESNKL